MNQKESILKQKSYSFALRTIKLYQFMANEHKEYVLSKQLLRSGTSIGANIAEAGQAQSKSDFIHKLSISLKEAVETEYWLGLLCDSGYLTKTQTGLMLEDCRELIRILTSSIKTAKRSS